MKIKSREKIVEVFMELFEPKANGKYEHKQIKSAQKMADLILEGPKILVHSDEAGLHSTAVSYADN